MSDKPKTLIVCDVGSGKIWDTAKALADKHADVTIIGPEEAKGLENLENIEIKKPFVIKAQPELPAASLYAFNEPKNFINGKKLSKRKRK